jgi:DNA-binding NtrC family response regulator
MNARLLIVDDELDILQSIAAYFTVAGYLVETALGAEKALEILACTQIDVMVSDIVMPGINGVELLRLVRAEYPMVKTIMITGYVTLDNALACMQHGADACVFKPLSDLSELQTEIEDALNRVNKWKKKLKELVSMKIG